MRPVIRTRFGRRALAGEVDTELAFHIEMRARQLMRDGLPHDEATAEARRMFGDLDDVRDTCITYDTERLRSMNRAHFLHDLRQDIGYAFRVIRRTPVVSLVIIVTLALGIGANTAIFSLVNAVLLRKLAVTAPDELFVLGDPTRVGSMGFDSNPRSDLHSYLTFRRLTTDTALVTGLAAMGRTERLEVRPDGSGTGETGRGRMVSGNYFTVLGVPAFLGRTLNASEDDVVGGAPVVVISHDYWTRRFAGDSSVIGREILLNDARFTVAGVAAESFTGEIVGQNTEIWIPLGMQGVLWPNRPILNDPQAYWLQLMGRLKPGVTLAQAREAYTTSLRRLLAEQATQPALVAQAETLQVALESGARGLSRVRNTYRAPLLILMVGVGLLLLIICANVANILMARAVARTREMSVRMAIGAGRGRLIRQLLAESLLLATLGAAAGLLVSVWMARVLLIMAADGGTVMPLRTGVGVAALAFTATAGLGAVVLFGLVPAWRASRADIASTMRASGKSMTSSGMGHRNPFGRSLIAAQVALSVVLIVGASLLVRSLQHLQRTETGLDRERLLVIDVDGSARGYDDERLAGLAQELRGRIAQIPGVHAVSFSDNGIFLGTESVANMSVPGFEVRERRDTLSYYDSVGPEFVKAAGARLIYGRDFDETDRLGTSRVVMLNESFSRHYFGSASPVGRSIRIGDSAYAEVIGVVADIKDQSLVGAARRRFYVSYVQQGLGAPTLLRLIVRSSGNPQSLIPSVRKAITDVRADIPVRQLIPLTQLMRESIREERLLARLAALFGATALILAAIGLYGVMSYAVSRRSGEIGLRVALGASRTSVIKMVLRDALLLVGIGVAVGVPMTLAAGRVIRGQLHGVEPGDPVAFGIALGVLLLGAVVAALMPAWRASRVTPLVALRAE